MALPTIITVSGTMLDIDGTPAKGHVAFYSGTPALSSETDSVVVPSYILEPFGLDGTFSVELPASDDPDWNPSGWTYTVVVNYNGSKYSFETVIPYDANGGLINFSELLPAEEGGSELYAAFNHTHAGGGGGDVAWNDVTGKPTTFPPSTHTHDDRYFTEAETTSAIGAHASDTTSVHGISDTSVLATNSSVSSAVASAISAIDYPFNSVAGKTGTVTLVKGDVGLGSVDNTTDLAKPVSTATTAALSGKANTSHTHTIANVTGLQTELDNLAVPVLLSWNGSAYVADSDARIYVGPNDPGSVPDGSVWIDTTP